MAVEIVREKLYTADEFWELATQPEYADKRLELIERVIYELATSFIPSTLAIRIAYFIMHYLMKNPLGYLTGTDGGYTMSPRSVGGPFPVAAFSIAKYPITNA